MKLIILEPISLTSSTVAASTENEWLSGTTYPIDAIVLVTSIQPYKEYKSLADGNLANDPITDRVHWEDLGVTNRWMMFDAYVSSQTVDTGAIECVLAVSNITNVSFFELLASTVQVVVYDNVSATEVYNEVHNLEVDPPTNWYDYWFSATVYARDLTVSIPAYFDATITVTITGLDGTAKCGCLTLGVTRYIGISKDGITIGIVDGSRKLSDAVFGTTYLKTGPWAKKVNIDVWLTDNQIDIVHRALVDVRGVPAVYDFNNESTSLTTLLLLGFYRGFEIIVPGRNISYCSFNVEGLT